MGTHSHKVEALLMEANDCELIGRLAATPEIREANRARALELRKLANQACKLDQASPHARDQEG